MSNNQCLCVLHGLTCRTTIITTERNQRHITEAVLPNRACFCWCLTAKRFMEFRKVQQWNPCPENRKHKLRERILRFADHAKFVQTGINLKLTPSCNKYHKSTTVGGCVWDWWVGGWGWHPFLKLKNNWIKGKLGSMVESRREWYRPVTWHPGIQDVLIW